MNSQVRPVHFGDFSGQDFERLVFAYALRDGFPAAEWIGQTGGDAGRDVWCGTGKAGPSVFLCANYRKLTLAKVASDLNRIARLERRPKRIFVVAGGSVSADLRDKIKDLARKLGFANISVWSGVEFEERVRRVAPDLLERFCHGEAFPDGVEDLRAFVAEPAPGAAPLNLSADAARLLHAMAEADDGTLVASGSHSGFGMSIGGKDFLPDTMVQRVRARWQRTIRDLVEHELIEEGPNGEIFVMTDAGYRVADTLVTRSAGGHREATPFVAHAIGNVTRFFREAAELIPEPEFEEGSAAATVPDAAAAFMRVYPVQRVPGIKSEREAKHLASGGDLKPMGLHLGGRSWSRNALGAIAYAGPNDGKLTNFTQLFSSSEICGVDLRIVHRIRRHTEKGDETLRVLMIHDFELACVRALQDFVNFSRKTLKYSGPLRVETGLQGINGCQISVVTRFFGKALKDGLRWAGEIATADAQAAECLRPFFEEVWDAFGVTRPPEAHERLLKGMG